MLYEVEISYDFVFTVKANSKSEAEKIANSLSPGVDMELVNREIYSIEPVETEDNKEGG